MTKDARVSVIPRDGLDRIVAPAPRADGISPLPRPTAIVAAAFACDVLYLVTGNPAAFHFSEYLLGASIILWAFNFVADLIVHAGMGLLAVPAATWLRLVGELLVLLLSLWNLAYRLAQNSGRAVLPYGIALTAAALCLALTTARLARTTPTEAMWEEADDAEFP